MSQTALPNIGANYDWEAGEDGWKDGMDLNLLMLDAFAQAVIVEQRNDDPWASSSSPLPGKMYLIGTAPTGTTAPWNTASAATIANKLAIATGNNAGVTRWHLVTPKDGWRVYNQDTKQKMTFRGTHGSGGRWVVGEGELPNVGSYTVLSLTTDTPPGSPALGDAYIVGQTPSGAWSTHTEKYAQYNGSAWEFTTPVSGMRVRLATTGEYYVYDGSNWVEELKYLAANSRKYTIVDVGNDGVGPFSADRAAPSYTLTREEASSQMMAIINARMLGSIDFTNAVGGSIVGNGTIGNFEFYEGAPEETWTLLCTAPGATATFSVTGSVSGAKAAATVGTPYDNGIIKFELTGGSTDFTNAGNADKIIFTAAYMPIIYSANDADVIPAMQGVLTKFLLGPICKLKAGTGELLLKNTQLSDLIQVAPLVDTCGSLLAQHYSPDVMAPKVSSEVNSYAANYTLKPGDEGKLIVMDTTGAGRTLTIPDSPSTQMLEKAVVRVFHLGANSLTISGAAGVTLVGTTAGTQNKILTLVRDGNTDTWYCG